MTTKVQPTETFAAQKLGARELVVKKETVKRLAVSTSVRAGARKCSSIVRTVYDCC